MHTRWSDGLGSIREMADAAIERGYEYIAITDHSKGLKIAGGINEEKLSEQACEIRKTNNELRNAGKRLRILCSIELNLSPVGAGDMDEHSLQHLDLVL